MTITSTSLWNELTTTDLVQLKDAVDVQVARLKELVLQHSEDPAQYPQARVFAGWHNNKSDLSNKLVAIIEARLNETLDATAKLRELKATSPHPEP